MFLISESILKTFDEIPIGRSMLRGGDINDKHAIIRETMIMKHAWFGEMRYRQFSFHERVSFVQKQLHINCSSFSTRHEVKTFEVNELRAAE